MPRPILEEDDRRQPAGPRRTSIAWLVCRVELRHLGNHKGPVLELRLADQGHERRNEAVPTQSRDISCELPGILASSRREPAYLVETQDQDPAARMFANAHSVCMVSLGKMEWDGMVRAHLTG